MRLPPGIFKTESGKYRVRFHKGGNQYATKTFSRLDDAKTWQSGMQRAKETGHVDQADADLMMLSQLAAEDMKARRPDMEAATFRNYRTMWAAHVRPHPIASMPLRAISVKVVEDFRDDLRAGLWRWDKEHDRPKKVAKADRKPVGEDSIRKTLAQLQTITNRAVRHGVIASNPFKLAHKPKQKGKTSSVRVIAPEGVEAIRGQMAQVDAVFVSVLAYTGCRPEDARALRWGDIGKTTIRIERSADLDGTIKSTKTKNGQRNVRLLKPLADDLAAWKKASGSPPDSALIFPRADGSAWKDTDYRNWRRRKFKPAVEAAGIDISRPYDLRHSAASLWIHEGINPVQVAQWMGHDVSETYKTYAHVIDDLDPADRQPAELVIEAVRSDMVLTWPGVQTRPKQSKRPRRTPRKQAKSEAPA